MLALFHDVGKIMPLMKKFEVSIGESHEVKSSKFFGKLLHLIYTDEEKILQYKPVVDMLKIMANDSKRAKSTLNEVKVDNVLIKTFHKIDSLARDMELGKIARTLS